MRLGWRSHRGHVDENAAEIQAHLELLIEQLIARGVSPDDARRQARLQFGNPRAKLEEVDALSRAPLVDALVRDLRYAVRTLCVKPGFTLIALSVIALAIGASTAIYSIVDAVLLRPLRFERPNELAAIGRGPSGVGPVGAAEFLRWRDRQDVFTQIAAIASDRNLRLKADGPVEPQIVRGEAVTADFFTVLHVDPLRGRPFSVDEEVDGRARVAVISYGLWRRYFGGTSDVIGKRLAAIDGDYEVVAVMPSDFSYPVGALEPTDVWVPYVVPAEERDLPVHSIYLRVIGRLRRGVSVAQAEQGIERISSAMLAEIPAPVPRRDRVGVESLQASLTSQVRTWLVLLLGAVACVLLIAAANLANLTLLRSSMRGRELAVRRALGASTRDLVRQVVAESVLLSMVGSFLAVVGAWLSTGVLLSTLPAWVPRLGAVAVNARVLVAVAAMTALMAIASTVGAIAGWAGPSGDHQLGADARRTTAGRAGIRLRSVVVASQVALAVVLLVGAGLFVGSFVRLMRVDLGFDYHDVFVLRIAPTGGAPASLARVADLVGRLPGVDAAAAHTGGLPFSLTIVGAPFSVPGREPPSGPGGLSVNQVSTDYFRAMRIPILRGRTFTSEERVHDAPVVILNATAAQTFFGSQDVLGQVVKLYGRRTIVGVAGDVRDFGPEGTMDAAAFVPIPELGARTGSLIVRTSRDFSTLLPAVKSIIWSEFPGMPIPPARSLETSLGGLIAQRRFNMRLLSLFGLVGLVIATVGIYGVMSHIVVQRTREIGIQIALGALPARVMGPVMRHAGGYLAAGLVAGTAAAWLLADAVEKFLFHVAAHELAIYLASAGLLAIAGLLAAWIPARRASRVDPLIALRAE